MNVLLLISIQKTGGIGLNIKESCFQSSSCFSNKKRDKKWSGFDLFCVKTKKGGWYSFTEICEIWRNFSVEMRRKWDGYAEIENSKIFQLEKEKKINEPKHWSGFDHFRAETKDDGDSFPLKKIYQIWIKSPAKVRDLWEKYAENRTQLCH
jgi:hypothetical protein